MKKKKVSEDLVRGLDRYPDPMDLVQTKTALYDHERVRTKSGPEVDDMLEELQDLGRG